jgi:polyphosphate kinase 2 (PPK2 family)
LAVDKAEYEERLEALQRKFGRLARELVPSDRGLIVVFEGWDAGGKGGCIRRMIRALDPRHYRAIPVSAPTDEELAHHYLWRFWRQLPPRGRITFYDRSWYGRVLVERVEGLAREAEVLRAYKEINDFEEQLVDAGIVTVKFWLHISSEEQLRRFEARARDPWKKHKLTPDDYRNREKRNLYESAANDMVERTSTEFAPWTLVEAEDKRYARLKVLETTCDKLEAALD